jgi:hypothetical protein
MAAEVAMDEQQKAFGVEVRIDARLQRVWAALTDPDEIRRWHGWDDEGLDDEIRYIYVDHATPEAPDRLVLEDDAIGAPQTIELQPDGAATVVRVTRPGPEGEGYDIIEEGWRSFFQQMRHYLERHPGEDRRTVFLMGKAVAADLTAALGDKLAGRPWFESTFQRGIATDDYGSGLVVLSAQEPLTSDRPGAVHITLTTHGLDDAAFTAAHDDWWTWWSSHVEKPEATVG